MNGRVFVTQESAQFNYSPAEQFGDVVFLTRHDLSPVPGSLANQALTDEMRHKLKSFDPATDYLAPSGSPIVSGLAFALLQQHGVRYPIRVLRWSNRDRAYCPITISI